MDKRSLFSWLCRRCRLLWSRRSPRRQRRPEGLLLRSRGAFLPQCSYRLGILNLAFLKPCPSLTRTGAKTNAHLAPAGCASSFFNGEGHFFLKEKLLLSLHPNKIIIRKFIQGIDFLGYIIFPHFTLLRTKTRRRILKNIKILKVKYDNKEISEKFFRQSLVSYLGILKHCRDFKTRSEVMRIIPKA